MFVGEIIIAWALYGILVHMNAFTLRGGVISAVLIWFGFVVTTMTANNAFGGRRPMLTVIDSVAWLGAFVIIGAIVGWMGGRSVDSSRPIHEPGLCRASTSSFDATQDVDGRDKPGHDELGFLPPEIGCAYSTLTPMERISLPYFS